MHVSITGFDIAGVASIAAVSCWIAWKFFYMVVSSWPDDGVDIKIEEWQRLMSLNKENKKLKREIRKIQKRDKCLESACRRWYHRKNGVFSTIGAIEGLEKAIQRRYGQKVQVDKWEVPL